MQPPGRGSRLCETPYDNMPQLIAALLDNIAPLLTQPYALFGHSLGSRVAFELCKQLIARGAPAPQMLFASGSRSPHIERQRDNWHLLSDAEFKDKLRSLNGTPEVALQNDELMSLLLPGLRADFKISDQYRAETIKLPCPISVLGAPDDQYVSVRQLQDWQALTAMPITTHIIDGGHFFLEKNRSRVLEVVSMEITKLLEDSRVFG